MNQGIGGGFVPELLDRAVIDEIFQVKNEEAFENARGLARNKGLLALWCRRICHPRTRQMTG